MNAFYIKELDKALDKEESDPFGDNYENVILPLKLEFSNIGFGTAKGNKGPSYLDALMKRDTMNSAPIFNLLLTKRNL